MPKIVDIPRYRPQSSKVDELARASSQYLRNSKQNKELSEFFETNAMLELHKALLIPGICPSDQAYCLRRIVSIDLHSPFESKILEMNIRLINKAQQLLLDVLNKNKDKMIVYELQRVLREKAHLAVELKNGAMLEATLQVYEEIKELAENRELEIEFKDREYTLHFSKNNLVAAKTCCEQLLDMLTQEPNPSRELKQKIYTQKLHLFKIQLIEISAIPSKSERKAQIESVILTQDLFWLQHDEHKNTLTQHPHGKGAIKQFQKDLLFLFACKVLYLESSQAKNYVFSQIKKMNLPTETRKILQDSCQKKYDECVQQNKILLSHPFFKQGKVPCIENITELQEDSKSVLKLER